VHRLAADLAAPEAPRQLTHHDPGAAAWVGAALEAVLRTRAPGIHASTPMVRQLAAKVSREMGLDPEAQALLDLAARVRDIGMVALPDSVVLATTPLTPADWELVNRHPVIGEQLLKGVFVVASAADIVRAHHERWDGDGYPDGRRGDSIPVLSRVIATCDAFVATATDRPHRRGMGAEAALEHICRQSGSQFEPRTVDALVAALHGDSRPPPTLRAIPGADAPMQSRAVARSASAVARSANVGPRDLMNAIAELDVVPVFAPAYERLLAATARDSTTGGELVTAIESDTGLTIAVLRHAQGLARRHPVANIADAVAAIGVTGIEEAIRPLPQADFPWRTTWLEVLMHRSRVHAQAVARAVDRIARAVEHADRDDLLVAALLHDIGKLVIGRADSGYSSVTESTLTPEKRIRQEQQTWGMDHASIGALLLRSWKLPAALANTVATHHSAESEDELATYVRLADMIAHHAQGDTIDRSRMLHLAQVCGLSSDALRNTLFDLPHIGGSRQRRAEPSPLSRRETAVLRILAEGKVYSVIAEELGLATSTVRTHLHNTYAKLAVADRAQAVLRATEMGWI
jgi:putative nucleotidyltransferase with HDIG domain